jgi:predicted DNA-binding transcriptional regulator AlpA
MPAGWALEGEAMAELPDVRFLTVAEVADLMRVSKMTVYRLVHSGELPAVRLDAAIACRSPR